MTDLLRTGGPQPPEEGEETAATGYQPEDAYQDEDYPDDGYQDDGYPDEDYPDEDYGDEGYPAGPPSVPNGKRRKKRKIGRIIAIVIAVVVMGALVWFLRSISQPKETQGEVLLDAVMRGSISSQVVRDGVAMPKNSASITVTAAGEVQEVYVTEGAQVNVGDPLFRMDSSTAQEAVDAAQESVNNSQTELNGLRQDQADLTITAPFKGKLLDCAELQNGQQVGDGDKLATLVDDSRMKLELYFSYAYEDAIYQGQAATISVPAATAQVSGRVEEIHKVRRVAPEGTVLFQVTFSLDNPGALTADMLATASLTTGGGEGVYPYESGTLAYWRTADITAKAGGPVEVNRLRSYADVSAGAVLVQLGAEDNSTAIAAAQNRLKSAQEELARAQEELAKTAPTAPIAGTVLSLGIAAGEPVESGTVAVSIADTSVMVVDVKVDDRNISYVKQGMMADIDMWGTMYSGIVTSVSLNGTMENGVSTFPAKIEVENPDGGLMSGSSVTCYLAASQSDDCLMVPIQSVKSVETEAGTIAVVYVQREAPPADMPQIFSEIPGLPPDFYPVEVETGIQDNSSVEILSGDLAEGETIFVQIMMSQADSFGW